MAYTVFFKEANQTFKADNFIDDQPVAHQRQLKSIADELAVHGTITHPQATKNSRGEWSVLLTDNGDAYMYTLFISRLESNEANTEVTAEAPKKKGVLVIIDPSGARDSIGGYHPGYYSVEQYVTFLEEDQSALFTLALHQILNNIPSESYTTNNDGSVSIHIERTGKTSTTSLKCNARWI
jgi:hypothetical protein